MKAGILGLFLLLISKPSPAQTPDTKASTEQTDQRISQLSGRQDNFISVTGTVKSADDNSALPAVSVVQKGTTNATFTDSNGEFELTIDKRLGKTLTFSFIGFETSEIVIREDNPAITILLTMDATILGGMEITGEVAIDQPYTEQRPGFFNRIGKRIKALFQHF